MTPRQLMSALSMGLLLIAGLPITASAELERYPTDQEVQQLVRQFQQKLPQLQNDTTGIYHDRRSPLEKQQLQQFTQAWNQVDPAVAPFLGEWFAIEESLAIYPTSVPGQVCIIDAHLDDVVFYLGRVSDRRVKTAMHLILVREGDYLASLFISEEKPGSYEYGNPRWVNNPTRQTYFQNKPEILRQFKQAGCQSGLPPVIRR